MKGLNGGIPLAVLAATAHAQGGIYKGPHGDDTGNAASVGHENSASNTANQDIKDDHSWKGYPGWPYYAPPPTWGHPWKRGDINEGPTGDDTGNKATIGIENEAESETTQQIKDDHSVKGYPGWPYYAPPPGWGRPWKRGDIHEGPTGDDTGNKATIGIENEAESETNQHIKDDHSLKGYPGWPWWKRGDINEGPTGDDTGNAANIGIKNEAEFETTQHIKDDHSVKGYPGWPYYAPPPGWGRPWKRGDIHEGPTGDDTGNKATIGIENEAESETTQDIKDDHSLKGHPGWPYWWYPYPGHPNPPYHGANRPAGGYHTGMKEARDAPGSIHEGPHGKDIGNVAVIPIKNSASNDFKGSYKDDHSVDIDYSWPWHQKRAFAPSASAASEDGEDEDVQQSPAITNNEMSYPGQDSHAANDAACQASEVTHTVTMTRTHTAMATETALAEEDPEFDAAQTPTSSQAAQNQYPSQAIQNPNIHSNMASQPAPVSTPVAQGSQAYAPEPTPNPNVHSDMATQAAPIPTPAAYGSEASAPSPTSGAYHAPAESEITMGTAGAYTVIPVYVPDGAAHGSVVIQASSTPASSSSLLFHARPTGASPEQNAASSSSATPSSSHGPVAFTGAAGKLAPSAGVFTALAGVAALLAFAL
ncbi:hypothetical protein ASPVEDRAFT_25221 [Aspergillus versicolor CBS 583.65]|uniref:Uncharacterized protein n=1 Tax=Aspergillus versicolor CBS 583.65 TaxID=1036611 RepID=A0A1L9PA52_ASPVE|nr:uncharacterized protein ASPVEDRAFT_25221 [Aspergillus versicolor CBS 583.65]OJI98334.1 hypothetical protein ASPVEDRAFT_25221 [Aspergillus versicolor CBS 583.65]